MSCPLKVPRLFKEKSVCSTQLTAVKHRERNDVDVCLMFDDLYLKGIDLKLESQATSIAFSWLRKKKNTPLKYQLERT